MRRFFSGILFVFIAVLPRGSLAAVSEAQFLDAIAEFTNAMSPTVAKRHRRLVVEPFWKMEMRSLKDGGAGGANPFQKKGVWGIQIVGGFARRPEIDQDTVVAALCHELGHHVVGIENEKGADWFAALTCLPQIWGVSPQTAKRVVNTGARIAWFTYTFLDDAQMASAYQKPSLRAFARNADDVPQCRLDLFRAAARAHFSKAALRPACFSE